MNENKLSELGVILSQATASIQRLDQHQTNEENQPKVHVPNVGNILLFAYEQLRNASENIEDHLLFQRATLRFYKRNISFQLKNSRKT